MWICDCGCKRTNVFSRATQGASTRALGEMRTHGGEAIDWSYSDQAQNDVIAKKGCHCGAREVAVTSPGAFSHLPQRQQQSTSGQNIQDITYFP